MNKLLHTAGLAGAAVLPAVFVFIFLANVFGFLPLEDGTSGALIIGAAIIITVFLYMQTRIRTEELQLEAKVKAEEVAQEVGKLRGENKFLKDNIRDLQNEVNDMDELYNLGKAYRERGLK